MTPNSAGSPNSRAPLRQGRCPSELCESAAEHLDEVFGVAEETGVASREFDQRRVEVFDERASHPPRMEASCSAVS